MKILKAIKVTAITAVLSFASAAMFSTMALTSAHVQTSIAMQDARTEMETRDAMHSAWVASTENTCRVHFHDWMDLQTEDCLRYDAMPVALQATR